MIIALIDKWYVQDCIYRVRWLKIKYKMEHDIVSQGRVLDDSNCSTNQEVVSLSASMRSKTFPTTCAF